jgi:CHAT domain-containing protein
MIVVAVTAAWLGADATEQRVKALDPSVRIVHFAVHGILNERFPLNSALALTIPDSPKRTRTTACCRPGRFSNTCG